MAEAMPTLGPQAALEEACVWLLRESLKLDASQCGRQFDGRPPPSCGDVYYSVWSKAARDSSSRTSLDERLGVTLTVTLRLKAPRDRWLASRDDLERRLNEARALLHLDSWDQRVIRLAGELGGRSQAGKRHVNFCEGLWFQRMEPVQVVAGEWFSAGKGGEVGLAQVAQFGGARLVQGIARAA